MRQFGPMRFVQSIQSVDATNCSRVGAQPSPEICAYPYTARSWALQVVAKVRSVGVYSVTRCTLLASLPLSLSLLHHGPFIVRSAQLLHRPNGFIQLLHPSRCSQPDVTIVCSAPPTSARFNSCAIPGTSCGGVWDPWSLEHQSCKPALLLLLCTSRDWLRSNISTFFAVGTFLILRSSS